MFQLKRFKLALPFHSDPQVEAGSRVYAVGDIHGRFDLLCELLAKIREDNHARPQGKVYVVLLGDLINRGSQSRQVVEMACQGLGPLFELIALKGNHEATLVAAWNGSQAACRQLHRMGVKETLRSYGADVEKYDVWDLQELGDIIRSVVPAQHIRFMEAMPMSWVCGDIVFVHASFAGGVTLEEQSEGTLLWSRQPYSPAKGESITVVHGHANLLEPANEKRRICVDTSAHVTGTLTAVGLESGHRWFLDTRR